jgi:hypothetical protein
LPEEEDEAARSKLLGLFMPQMDRDELPRPKELPGKGLEMLTFNFEILDLRRHLAKRACYP